MSEYSEMTAMFHHLKTLEDGSPAFRRQRDDIIRYGLPLADHIARRYSGRGEPFDDLVQAARAGLVNSVNRYDVDNGADFLSFAVPTMLGEVRRHFRDHTWAVKVPRRVKELQPQLNKARAELSQRLGRAPKIVELAEHLGMTADELDAVATFYNMIFRRQVGRHVIFLCDSVSCWIMGLAGLRAQLKQKLDVDFGETSRDRQYTLLPVACLGACDHAPALLFDGELHGDMNAQKLDALVGGRG